MKRPRSLTGRATAVAGGSIRFRAGAVALGFAPGFAAALAFGLPAAATEAAEVDARLAGLDEFMNGIVKDWNLPGVGVAVVHRDKAVLARGYGYRDYGKKLPFTSQTVMPIASNTKLFTAVAAGLLVEEGKLDWDEPIRERVPSIRFSTETLNAQVTLRDMLSHRAGLSRHDTIWYKSAFTRAELFDRLRFLEPSAPFRQTFLYNNLLFTAAGQVIEVVSGQSWENTVQRRILDPLEMTHTVFSIEALMKEPDHGVPYAERRDSFELYEIPPYADTAGMGPCGSLISNLDDLSHWTITLLNEGRYGGKQVVPAAVLKETMVPAIALPNTNLESRGWGELLNQYYGAGRFISSYRGHLLALHGGALPGFYSQLAVLPQDEFGVIVLVIGDHAGTLPNFVTYSVIERLLGLSPTPWSQRGLEARLKDKAAGTAARGKAGAGRVAGTKPSHPLDEYTGQFENPAYGVVKIERRGEALHFTRDELSLPLSHFHYDRFDSPDDERDGLWSFNFLTSPAGEIDKIILSLDEAEATFTRRADPELSRPDLLRSYAGSYELPDGRHLTVKFSAKAGELAVRVPGQPPMHLVPWRPQRFRTLEFSNATSEFVVEAGRVTALKQIDPSGELVLPRK